MVKLFKEDVDMGTPARPQTPYASVAALAPKKPNPFRVSDTEMARLLGRAEAEAAAEAAAPNATIEDAVNVITTALSAAGITPTDIVVKGRVKGANNARFTLHIGV